MPVPDLAVFDLNVGRFFYVDSTFSVPTNLESVDDNIRRAAKLQTTGHRPATIQHNRTRLLCAYGQRSLRQSSVRHRSAAGIKAGQQHDLIPWECPITCVLNRPPGSLAVARPVILSVIRNKQRSGFSLHDETIVL